MGWEYRHLIVDDRSRLAFTQQLPSECSKDATAFLNSSLAWLRGLGITVQSVMTDNGVAYRSQMLVADCASNKVAHKRTRHYTPKTNGKAERFIKSRIREQAYACPFTTAADRHVERLADPTRHFQYGRRNAPFDFTVMPDSVERPQGVIRHIS
ncbi:MAG: DDE-type integrase/transposase/recombinase [Acetobacteraceae bacterium]